MSMPRKALSAVRFSSLSLGACAAMCLGARIALAAPDSYSTLAANTVSGEPPRDTGRSTGAVVDDSVITAKVKSALIADDDVKAFDITVKTRQGEVILTGVVESRHQAERAIDIAGDVNGVKTVSNRLTVKK